MSSEANPYDPEKQPNLYKMWERREARRKKKKVQPKKPISDEVKEEIERRPGYLKRRKNNQSTDSNN